MHWSVERRANDDVVVLKGAITDSTDLTPLAHNLRNAAIEFDLAGIDRISSGGVRQWLLLIKELEQREVALRFVRCPPVLLRQFQMIQNFSGQRGQLLSVLTPYCCATCDTTASKLVDLRQDTAAQIAEAPACGECGAQMEFDDVDRYYIF
jgi:eukaryotic-like serine/threonine-protein kinase